MLRRSFMSSCNIDHSKEDTILKLQSQQEFMPKSIYERVTVFLQSTHGQDKLNALFHLLKKYDLASSEEQVIRNHSIIQLLSSED
jgi:hypothetical protein